MTIPGILTIKLHRPSVPVKWVPRARLNQRLSEGLALERRVTLVSAPAGFGKTTCICDWLNTLEGAQVAWLSLEPADNDPGRFFTYLVAALQTVRPDLGREIEAVIRSGQLPTAEAISATLVNDVLAFEGQILLALDDFHVIQDGFIQQVFEQLIANFPHPLHLVLITREDPPLPLARLRANNRLTEIRARDLRFTSRDIDSYLNEVMSLSLSQGDIATLAGKTEGWIAGLQLAALAMQSSGEVREQNAPSAFIATLSGGHRFILGYLTEQVLDQQPQEIRQFLLETSILDKLNGELCNAVTGRTDGSALLEQLFNANLFLISLDDQRQWYRYHHLFADLLGELRNALQKEKTGELHRRASRWYAQAGMTNEAIRHALDGEDYAGAVDLLEHHAMQMIMQGYATTVDGWVKALPAEWRARSPHTDIAFAWALVLRGAYSQLPEYLERLRATWVDSPWGERNPALQAEWMVLQALVLYMQEETDACAQMAAQALALAPQADRRVRGLAYYVQASVAWVREEYSLASENYRKSIHHSLDGGNPVAEVLSTTGLSGMALELGQLHLAFETASQAIARIERAGVLAPISASIYASLGDAHFQWFQIEAARRCYRRGLHLSALGGVNTVTLFCHLLLARLFQIEGDLEAALAEVRKAKDLMPLEAPDYVRQEIATRQVRLYLALDRPAAAQTALQALGIAGSDHFTSFDLSSMRLAIAGGAERLSFSLGQSYNSLLHLLLYRAQAANDPALLEAGLELATQVLTRAFESRQMLVALETLLLRARMHVLLGDHPAAGADTIRALELGEPEGFIGVFVEQGPPVAKALAALAEGGQPADIWPEYVNRILEAFSGQGKRQPAAPISAVDQDTMPVEALTDREVDVLRLMAAGLKYREIAEKLFISLNTVRYHVKAIYAKLNASNRIQAIELARRLRIL